METKTNNNTGVRKFITVLADGKFHQSVPEGTEGAVIRKYKDKDDVEHSKTELVFDEVSGIITHISFKEGDYGKSLEVQLDGDGVISVSTLSNFGEDLMKKLPALDLTKPVRLVPYAFADDKGKNRRGTTVYQDDQKVYSFYSTKDNQPQNGIPAPEGDVEGFDSDDWKMHFMKVRKFLVGEVEKLAVTLGA